MAKDSRVQPENEKKRARVASKNGSAKKDGRELRVLLFDASSIVIIQRFMKKMRDGTAFFVEI